MKAAITAMCLVVLSGCVVLPVGTVAPPAGGGASQQGRERFTFASTTTRATLAYACTPGNGAAARAQSTHVAFDAALSGFVARQAAASIAARDAGQLGAAFDADLRAQGDAFSANQRAELDARYGCIPAGNA